MGLTSVQLYMPSTSPPVSQLLLAHSVPFAWCLYCYIPVFDPHNVLAFLRFFLPHPPTENFLPLHFWGEERVRMTAGDLDCSWRMSVCHRGLSALQSTAHQEESSPAWDGIISISPCREARALKDAVWIQRGQRLKYAFFKMPNRIADLSNHSPLIMMFPKECTRVGRLSLFLVHINLK